jgi:hypothetical protein
MTSLSCSKEESIVGGILIEEGSVEVDDEVYEEVDAEIDDDVYEEADAG